MATLAKTVFFQKTLQHLKQPHQYLQKWLRVNRCQIATYPWPVLNSPHCSRLRGSLSHGYVRTTEGGQVSKHSAVILTCRFHQKCCLHTSSFTLAGHNKWSKVKHIKGPKDSEKSLMTAKVISQMRVAVREGGHNPESNPELSHLINVAKSKGVPKSTVENFLKNATKSKHKVNQAICEVQGPKGAAVVVEYMTDNQKRTRDELLKIVRKHGCSVAAQGTLLYAFKRKGILEVNEPEGQSPLTFDMAMDLAIELGAEDVLEEEENGKPMYKLICDKADFRSVREALHKTPYQCGMASLDYIAETTTELNASELEKIGSLISDLEMHPDVTRISHNVTEES
ncbi:Translational activator of cytochrome c oxidase 1 [Holothuria leucospilota]|uniref:Translational activator of cytochrome c oxidase 1 n=1 Tax=Holothuria leucospilota TaxID=206669 RepID=A0A9Q0YM44_HOLLE|nr:Translational activator of cytochrome c oxidase 1 [Holothuria leucospilota]